MSKDTHPTSCVVVASHNGIVARYLHESCQSLDGIPWAVAEHSPRSVLWSYAGTSELTALVHPLPEPMVTYRDQGASRACLPPAS